MTTLLSLSIGPVQDFIAAARKTRDLWFGSTMLSEISRAVAQSLPPGSELIFPSPNSVSDPQAAVANKILAIVPGRAEDLPTIADVAKRAAHTRLIEYLTDVRDTLRTKGVRDAEIDFTLTREQLDHFLEFYAAWWPIDKYDDARRKVERLLAGRKALRDFAPAVGKPVPKSSLDGGRETVLSKDLAKKGNRRLGIKAGEQLDGISLIKRVAGTQRFVSVARVAIDPLIRRLMSDEGFSIITDLTTIAEKLRREEVDLVQRFHAQDFPQYRAFPYDTQLFYGEPSEVECEQLTPEQQELVQGLCNTVRQAHATLKLGEPPAYFAVLIGDGDYMGKAIREMREQEEHRHLSDRLVDFATQARDIVEQHFGALVYSGGDDVLALLPLDTALACADALRHTFAESVGAFCTGKSATIPTFSCGVSIAHFGEHLQHLLKWGRAAERAAKDNGRDSLAVHLHTRTAGETSVAVVHKWGEEPVSTRWEKWTKLLMDDAIPKGAIYELRHLAAEFDCLPESLPEILRAEVTRILKRKQAEQGTTALTEETIERTILCDWDNSVDGLNRLVNELLIARHLARVARIVAGREG